MAQLVREETAADILVARTHHDGAAVLASVLADQFVFIEAPKPQMRAGDHGTTSLTRLILPRRGAGLRSEGSAKTAPGQQRTCR